MYFQNSIILKHLSKNEFFFTEKSWWKLIRCGKEENQNDQTWCILQRVITIIQNRGQAGNQGVQDFQNSQGFWRWTKCSG